MPTHRTIERGIPEGEHTAIGSSNPIAVARGRSRNPDTIMQARGRVDQSHEVSPIPVRAGVGVGVAACIDGGEITGHPVLPSLALPGVVPDDVIAVFRDASDGAKM